MIHKMLNHPFRSLILLICTGLWVPGAAANAALMDLIELLHDKGDLSDEEYRTLTDAVPAGEVEDDAARAASQDGIVKEMSVAGSDKITADWTSRIDLKGDIRLRYQTQDNDPGDGRTRGRLRYRLGVIGRPGDGWEIGAGLASGSSDLRSTNQTFTGTFSSKPVNLDYAYAQYAFNDHIKAVGGKFKFPGYLYTPSDLMWDGDINPEGFSVNFKHGSALGTTFANTGLWILEENDGEDPHLIYGQLGQDFSAGDLFATTAATYYAFRDNDALGDFETADPGTNTDYRFNGVYALSGEIGITDLFGSGITTSLVADWVVNGDTVTPEDKGYLVGLKASRGPWAFKYLYADLEANAWPDILPDSDRFDGLTGVSGHEIAIEYELNDYVLLGIDYYAMQRKSDGVDQDLLQLDLNVRF